MTGSRKFVARQPIFDRSQRTVGYELLFRSGMENCFPKVDREIAARSVIDESFLTGIDVLCDGRWAFINCTGEVLEQQLVTALPPQTTVIEVLESIEASDEIVLACRKLKNAGYRLALDDFVPNGPQRDLLKLADIVKLDIQALAPEELRSAAADCLGRGLSVLAEKVETKAEFDRTYALGFTHFQGYFFAKPAMISLPELPALSLSRIRLLQCIVDSELDYAEIESIIKSDTALCYRLLRYLNSARFVLRRNVNSIRHALSLLGDQEIRRWVTLVVALIAVQSKPAALLQHALVRARFCEGLAPPAKWRGSDLFFLGLFSLLDAILNMPMTELLERVSLPDRIREALLGGDSKLGQVLKLVQAYESANWNVCDQLAQALGMQESTLSELYLASVAWTTEFAGLAAHGS